MVQFAGKYQLMSNDNLVAYLKAVGIPDDSAVKADQLKPIIEVIVDGDKYTINSDSGVKNAAVSFTLNQEFDDLMPLGHVLKSIAKLDGNKIIITSKSADGRSGDRTYEFSDAGCVLSMTEKSVNIVAKRHYKRL